MPNEETIEFVRDVLMLTWEDPTFSFWEKVKFTVWMFYVTAPVQPRFFL